MPTVNPIHVQEGEVVDIHWRLKSGRILVERRTCPPAATTAAKLADTSPDPITGGPTPPKE